MHPGLLIIQLAILVMAAVALGCSQGRVGAPPSGTADAASDSEPLVESIPLPGLGVRVALEPIAPIVPVFAEGAQHLLYELRLTGFDPRRLRLDSVEVLGAGTKPIPLASFSAHELQGMTVSLADEDPLVIRPGTQSVVFFHLALAPEDQVAFPIRHRLWFTYPRRDGHQSLLLEGEPVPVSSEEPLEIAPPLRGGPWYAQAGPANASHHRRTLAPRNGILTMDQRFATDWFLLSPAQGGNGPNYSGPDWEGTIGAEAYAVADGVVVAAPDGIPDEAIGELGSSGVHIDWDTIGGNRVVIDLGDGRYAWYHHLKSGSLRVRPGERVHRGQLVGLVGNSGQTSHPHLHFEITDSDVLGQGNGLPFVFECFSHEGRVVPMPSWYEVAEGDPQLWLSREHLRVQPGTAHVRWRELPLGGAVVRFSDGTGRCED